MNEIARPLVSVVLPVRDGGPELVGAVRSILSQTYHRLELVIIDDGSTDRRALRDCVEEFGGDRRMRLIEAPPVGVGAALNRGIDAASGEVLARMDGDDVAHPNRIATQVMALAEQKVWAVGTAVHSFSDRRAELRPAIAPRHLNPRDVAVNMLLGNCIYHPTVAFARWRGDVRYTENIRFEDYDLWLRRVAEFSVAVLPQRLLRYRVSKQSSSYQGLELSEDELGHRFSQLYRELTGATPTADFRRLVLTRSRAQLSRDSLVGLGKVLQLSASCTGGGQRLLYRRALRLLGAATASAVHRRLRCAS